MPARNDAMTRSAARTAANRWTVTGCIALDAWLVLIAIQAPALRGEHLITDPAR
jgi:hypothetical protein